MAVEPVGSVTFGGAPGKRNIPGIGTSVRPKLADLAKPDRIVAVSEEKTVEACLSFVRDYHLLVGGSTGTVLAAVQQLAPEFRRGDTIVAISADLGEKYLDTIYDPAWVEKVIVPEMTGQCELMRSSRPSEAQKKRLIVVLTARAACSSGNIRLTKQLISSFASRMGWCASKGSPNFQKAPCLRFVEQLCDPDIRHRTSLYGVEGD